MESGEEVNCQHQGLQEKADFAFHYWWIPLLLGTFRAVQLPSHLRDEGYRCRYRSLHCLNHQVSILFLGYSQVLILTSLLSAASVFGRIVPSYLSDKFGSLLVMSIMAFSTSLTVLIIWIPVNFAETLAGVMIFTVLYGFTSGAFVSIMTPALVQLCGGQINELGLMLGTFMAINSFA
jgi:MFS family permease